MRGNRDSYQDLNTAGQPRTRRASPQKTQNGLDSMNIIATYGRAGKPNVMPARYDDPPEHDSPPPRRNRWDEAKDKWQDIKRRYSRLLMHSVRNPRDDPKK